MPYNEFHPTHGHEHCLASIALLQAYRQCLIINEARRSPQFVNRWYSSKKPELDLLQSHDFGGPSRFKLSSMLLLRSASMPVPVEGPTGDDVAAAATASRLR